jgi:hypothetical protein
MLAGKPEGQRQLWSSEFKSGDNIKIDLKEIGSLRNRNKFHKGREIF